MSAAVRALIVAALAAVAIAAVGCGEDDSDAPGQSAQQAPGTATATTATTETTPQQQPSTGLEGIPQSGVTLGDPSAKVTLYEFVDLQCPFCAQFSEGAFGQIVEEYVRPGKVKIVFRNLTFLGPDSVTAARAAAAAGAQDKLWDFVKVFFANQGAENSGYVTEPFIEEIATKAGVDVERLDEDMSSPDVEKQLAEAQQMAERSGVNSTPSFLIQVGNGEPKQLGNETAEFDELSKLLDRALAGS